MLAWKRFLIVIALSGAVSARAYDNRSASQRKAEEARRKTLENARKEKEDKEAAKLNAERAEWDAKQQETAARREAAQRQERRELYSDAPKVFFEQFIENKLVFTERGGFDDPGRVEGRIVQIPTPTTVILQIPGTDRWVAIENVNTAGLVDDMRVSFPVQDAGTFRYTTVLGAVRTVQRYVSPRTMTFREFEALGEKGVDVLDAYEKYLVTRRESQHR